MSKSKLLAIGQTVPGTDYVVVENIGEGGQGVVARVRDSFLEQDFVMKLLDPALARDEDAALRFKREAMALSKLRHPNVVYVIKGGLTAEEDRRPFYVMEHHVGLSLGKVLQDRRESARQHEASRRRLIETGQLKDDGRPPERGVLSLEKSLIYASQVLEGLHEAHSVHQIVHRDIKPQNILIVHVTATESKALVIDFGIAKLLNASTRLTGAGHFVGTYEYAAPEQHGGKVGPATDIYAVALVLFESLTGEHLFSHIREKARVAGSRRPYAEAHLSEVPRRLSAVVDFINHPAYRQLDDLLFAMLEKHATRRPQSALDVATQLRQIRQELSRHFDQQLAARTSAGATTDEPIDRMLAKQFELMGYGPQFSSAPPGSLQPGAPSRHPGATAAVLAMANDDAKAAMLAAGKSASQPQSGVPSPRLLSADAAASGWSPGGPNPNLQGLSGQGPTPKMGGEHATRLAPGGPQHGQQQVQQQQVQQGRAPGTHLQGAGEPARTPMLSPQQAAAQQQQALQNKQAIAADAQPTRMQPTELQQAPVRPGYMQAAPVQHAPMQAAPVQAAPVQQPMQQGPKPTPAAAQPKYMQSTALIAPAQAAATRAALAQHQAPQAVPQGARGTLPLSAAADYAHLLPNQGSTGLLQHHNLPPNHPLNQPQHAHVSTPPQPTPLAGNSYQTGSIPHLQALQPGAQFHAAAPQHPAVPSSLGATPTAALPPEQQAGGQHASLLPRSELAPTGAMPYEPPRAPVEGGTEQGAAASQYQAPAPVAAGQLANAQPQAKTLHSAPMQDASSSTKPSPGAVAGAPAAANAYQSTAMSPGAALPGVGPAGQAVAAGVAAAPAGPAQQGRAAPNFQPTTLGAAQGPAPATGTAAPARSPQVELLAATAPAPQAGKPNPAIKALIGVVAAAALLGLGAVGAGAWLKRTPVTGGVAATVSASAPALVSNMPIAAATTAASEPVPTASAQAVLAAASVTASATATATAKLNLGATPGKSRLPPTTQEQHTAGGFVPEYDPVPTSVAKPRPKPPATPVAQPAIAPVKPPGKQPGKTPGIDF